MVKKINWTKDDIECRTVDGINGEPYTELIKWNIDDDGRRWCYTLAYFRKDKDGYANLVFVGDRPYKDISEIDINNIWKELWLTQLFIEGENNDD